MNEKTVMNEEIIKEKMFHYFLNSLDKVEKADFITEDVADMVEYIDMGSRIQISFINRSSKLISVFVAKSKVEKIFEKVLKERGCQSPEELLFSTMRIGFVMEYEYFQDQMETGWLVLVSVEDGYVDEDDSPDYEYDSSLDEICESQGYIFAVQLLSCNLYDEGASVKFQYTYDSRECFYEVDLTVDDAEELFGCDYDLIPDLIGKNFIVELEKYSYIREYGNYTKSEYYITALKEC